MKNQLLQSSERRLKNLMIRTLEKFEQFFPEKDSEKSGQLYKNDLRNIFNDALRAQRDEFNDYDINFRPIRIENDKLIIMPSFIKSIKNVIFDDKPSILFTSESSEILDSLRSELGCGALYRDYSFYHLEIVGIHNCVDKILPFMDKYYLGQEREKYKIWRGKVIEIYKR